MHKTLFALAAAAIVCGSACAQTVVSDAWVRATVAAQTTGGAYLSLRSPDAARVVKGASPLADSVEIHTMQMNGTVMSMREVAAIALPAGQPVSNFHLMLIGLKRPLKEGERVPLTLVVERQGGKRETVQVEVAVKPLTYQATPRH
ncbi:copper chaperone PCu(A)C [Massilia sp. DWR3-1-1]|uniref:copper chaperone PCu(A)C n=1 Tax=Massilia sp. DWR3-1-1 TaxID=2804559 RepID=UPI003CEA10B3